MPITPCSMKEDDVGESRFKDFVQLAIEKETEAAALYDKYASLVESGTAKQLLADMAVMERGHEAKLREFLQTGSAYFSKIGVIEDMHVSDFMTQPELTDTSSIEDAFVFAMKEEQKAHDLYVKLGALETDAQVTALFKALADEESRHKHDLEAEYEKEFMREG
ncbi:MAG: hypothetical protein GF418_06495 [Chitinivibrionales bacterium]|nr:hypothetical protein [Chitinivibrionales bacterium]MBD3395259.1 hypothetical protein [Chitinivibrionales bacterium]